MMTATIHISKGSEGVWLGLMTVTRGNRVEQFAADGPKVAAVMLALTTELVKLDTSERRVVLPDDEVAPPFAG